MKGHPGYKSLSPITKYSGKAQCSTHTHNLQEKTSPGALDKREYLVKIRDNFY